MNYLYFLRNPEVQCRIHKGSPIITILSRINPIPRIDTNLFKVHSNIVLPSTPRPPQRSLSCRFTCKNFESAPTFLHSGYMPCPSKSSRFNHHGTNYEVPHCGAFSTPHSLSSFSQIFASGSCFQIPLAWIISDRLPEKVDNSIGHTPVFGIYSYSKLLVQGHGLLEIPLNIVFKLKEINYILVLHRASNCPYSLALHETQISGIGAN